MRPRPTPPVPTEVQGLIDEARSAERMARYSVAAQRYHAALYRLADAGHGPLASALLRWIGRSQEAAGDLLAAMDSYAAARAVAELSGSCADLAHVLNCQGILLFRRGRLEEAYRLYGEARSLAEAAGEGSLVAMIDQNLGNVANVHGDHVVAHDCYLRSLERYRALGLEEYIGPLLNNIGRVHTDLENWDEAAAVFRQAEESCARAGNLTYQVLVKVNTARLHLSREDPQRARDACDDALEMSLRLGEDRWSGEIHKQAGMIMRRLGRPGIAEANFERAIEEARRREELLLEAEICKEKAILFRSQQRNREMLASLNQAHRAFEQLRARRDLADVSGQIATLEREFERIVKEWGDSIESADRYTKGHCERVAGRATWLARAAGVDPTVLAWFRMGALLHDVGKVCVPSEILNKSGPLDGEEWEIIKQHPERGAELLAEVDFPWDIRAMVLHHHEHWDGSGYPHGLAGEDIPLPARILCVADVYDALTTTRSYREAFAPRVALEIMQGDAGHIFDPDLFALFRALTERRVGIHEAATPIGWSGPWAGIVEPLERRPPVSWVA